MFYTELISRNWAFLSEEQQTQIKKKKIAIAGCGLGSLIAELAARTGFTKFALADGDKVEISNLNRQAFSCEHIGKNKARATAKIIKSINPRASVKVIDKFLESRQDMVMFLKDVDLTVNTIDINANFLEFNDVAATTNIPVLFPLNIGWGSVVLVFTKNAISLRDLLQVKCSGDDEIFNQLMQFIFREYFPSYLETVYRLFQQRNIENWPCDPQLGVAGYLSATLIVTAMVLLVCGEEIIKSPSLITMDALLCLRR